MSAPQWFPVACAHDLAERHVFAGELQGVELAIWRDDDGCVNVWDNRCCHRGARLSMGVNTGHRVRCQYHGWQYRSGDGQCIVLPAASQTPPPTSVCAHTFMAHEAHGLIWMHWLAPAGAPLALALDDWLIAPPAAGQAQHALQSFVLHAEAGAVRAQLARYRDCDAGLAQAQSQESGHALSLAWSEAGAAHALFFLLQPARTDKTIVHAVLQVPHSLAIAPWHARHQKAMQRLRGRLIAEGCVSAYPTSSADEQYVLPPERPKERLRADERLIKVRVARVLDTAEEIRAFELEPVASGEQGALADFIPGAHIDVKTPSGILRQYSIASSPGEVSAQAAHGWRGVTIGVKCEPASRGGSASMHAQLKAGDLLEVSRPKNHFRLANSGGALFLAAGIGITPILSMAAQMAATGRDYRLHYFARSQAHVAFGERLQALGHAELHLGLSAVETASQIAELLGAMDPGMDVYVCGPRAFLDAIVAAAVTAGLAAERVHFELFSNTVSHQNDKPFKVRLAKSGRELDVPVGQSLAEVLNARGAAVELSCEQGVCGTCMVTVLEGEPEHRDVYLSEDEKRTGHCMQACVSRSRSGLLVLDL